MKPSIYCGVANGLDDGDILGPVVVACAYIMRHRRHIPYNVWYSPTSAEVTEFLNGLDRRQHKLLKQIADNIVPGSVRGHA